MIKKLENKKIKMIKSERGFTLLIAVITTSMLLLISFVVVNISFKQLLLADASEQSQHAFYASDAGLECALYWDLGAGPVSAFATETPGTIQCSDETISTGDQNVPTFPSVQSLIGGGGLSDPMSIFFLVGQNTECVIVKVTKCDGTVVTNCPYGKTKVDSRGYNTCDITASRRFERGVTITY